MATIKDYREANKKLGIKATRLPSGNYRFKDYFIEKMDRITGEEKDAKKWCVFKDGRNDDVIPYDSKAQALYLAYQDSIGNSYL